MTGTELLSVKWSAYGKKSEAINKADSIAHERIPEILRNADTTGQSHPEPARKSSGESWKVKNAFYAIDDGTIRPRHPAKQSLQADLQRAIERFVAVPLAKWRVRKPPLGARHCGWAWMVPT